MADRRGTARAPRARRLLQQLQKCNEPHRTDWYCGLNYITGGILHTPLKACHNQGTARISMHST